MEVKTTDGITIILTVEQIALIDEQVKAQQKPVSIMDRVKSWEDAFQITKPTHYLERTGRYAQFFMESGVPPSVNNYGNVTSKKRALSLLAYAQLSVIADALNEGWEPDWALTSVNKYRIQLNHDGNEFEVDGNNWIHYATIYFKSRELAKYTITQFPQLWKQYFMID